MSNCIGLILSILAICCFTAAAIAGYIAAHNGPRRRQDSALISLAAALKDCADALEGEIKARPPSQKLRIERDMAPVKAARAALRKAGAPL